MKLFSHEEEFATPRILSTPGSSKPASSAPFSSNPFVSPGWCHRRGNAAGWPGVLPSHSNPKPQSAPFGSTVVFAGDRVVRPGIPDFAKARPTSLPGGTDARFAKD